MAEIKTDENVAGELHQDRMDVVSHVASSRVTWRNLTVHLQSNRRHLIVTIRRLAFHLSC